MSDLNNAPMDIHPRDVMGPIATLLGLLVASVGFIRTSNLQAPTIELLTGLLIALMVIFTATAGSASLYFYTKKQKYWDLALFFYPLSWFSFGVGAVLIFFALNFNITHINIPSPFGTSTLGILKFFDVLIPIVGVGFAVYSYLKGKRFEEKLKSQVNEAYKKLEDFLVEGKEKVNISDLSIDEIKMRFFATYIKIELLLQKKLSGITGKFYNPLPLRGAVPFLVKFAVIDKNSEKALDYINVVRNNIEHGVELPKEEILTGFAVATNLLKKFEKGDSG